MPGIDNRSVWDKGIGPAAETIFSSSAPKQTGYNKGAWSQDQTVQPPTTMGSPFSGQNQPGSNQRAAMTVPREKTYEDWKKAYDFAISTPEKPTDGSYQAWHPSMMGKNGFIEIDGQKMNYQQYLAYLKSKMDSFGQQ